ncbi:hypothetical protein K1719_027758 [Acacia pycnantha]|nr:hypothetical protein K1719_027758 [Acacia pycnantha]
MFSGLDMNFGGVDVIETYVFWNIHELSPGNYYFGGQIDLVKFVMIVQQAGIPKIGACFCCKTAEVGSNNKNLVDEVWTNRPPAEINAVIVRPLEFVGRSVADKLKFLREKLRLEKTQGIIFTVLLDEVAWLYNIRGSDVAYCPVVHAFAIVTLNSAFFYVDKSAKVKTHLEGNGIEIKEYTAVSSDVALLAVDELVWLYCLPPHLIIFPKNFMR